MFKKEEVSVAEVVTLVTKNYKVNDLNLKEPDIEEVVRHIYENRDKLVRKIRGSLVQNL